jgi:hypothetical protein
MKPPCYVAEKADSPRSGLVQPDGASNRRDAWLVNVLLVIHIFWFVGAGR